MTLWGIDREIWNQPAEFSLMRWRVQGVLWSVLTATPHVACAQDSYTEVNDPAARSGFAVHVDNDLFSGGSRDQDYSWGLAATFASPRVTRLFAPVDSLRENLQSVFTFDSARNIADHHTSLAAQVGMLAMTPDSLASTEPTPGDRPYASLLFVSTSETRVLDGGNAALFTSFTVGMLGLGLAEATQRTVHRVLDVNVPRGWKHQISHGGEPTLRYVQAKQWLLGDIDRSIPASSEWKLTVSASGGYLTEGTVALAGRWGRLQSSWWSFAPELGDYMAAPLTSTWNSGADDAMELFVFAGVRLKAHVYNALLQGQFRHSEVRVNADDLARLRLEGWFGIAAAWSDLRVSYTIRCATPEITREPGRRSLIWAGISVEKSF